MSIPQGWLGSASEIIFNRTNRVHRWILLESIQAGDASETPRLPTTKRQTDPRTRVTVRPPSRPAVLNSNITRRRECDEKYVERHVEERRKEPNDELNIVIEKRVSFDKRVSNRDVQKYTWLYKTNGASCNAQFARWKSKYFIFKDDTSFFTIFLPKHFVRSSERIYVSFVMRYFESANDGVIIVLGRKSLFVFSHIYSIRFLSFICKLVFFHFRSIWKGKGSLQGDTYIVQNTSLIYF